MEKLSYNKLIPLSMQHALAMFGGSILIPLIMGIDVSTAFLMNGIGTIIYIIITQGKSPAFLGSSGAFLAPTLLISSLYGIEYAISGFFFVGVLAIIFSVIIYYKNKYYENVNILDIVLPPASMGIIVSLIGLDLIKYTTAPGKLGVDLNDTKQVIVFLITLVVAIIGTVFFKGFYKTIAILISIIIGYISSVYFGLVSINQFDYANLIYIPKFYHIKFSIKAILIMLPVVFVSISEHISHQVVTSSVIGRDLLKDPGLHKTLFADNFSTVLSSLIGGPATTTYAENIGVMAISKVYDYRVLVGASIFSIMFAFIKPMQDLISSIPGAVIGGVTFILYGMIAISGIRIIVDRKVDYSNSKNLILSSVVLVTGLSNLKLNVFGVSYTGMLLASLVAIVLGIVFYVLEKIFE
ncbi:solute carrier family 23 protein [Oceanivirga miroungae]|uniref:Uracil permease n=1 Tax=Oceanivirga miroungae TaxID=1130046 RepID=A0A6I8M898_9FUSO|nr:solute carrier family 23 protein [Oceanivirga miroungae]VWL85681.1 Uracil permease [Oceanivirga miroungae]